MGLFKALMQNSGTLKETLGVWGWGLAKVPMLFYVKPVLKEISDDRVVFLVPYRRANLNHYKSMYFGVMAAGADLAGGFLGLYHTKKSGEAVGLLFKDFKADFHKRAEGDTLFTCEDGQAIAAGVQRAIDSGERQNFPVKVVATCPDKLGTEPVATFTLTLSLKLKKKES
jgi:acyl-coenzyme A thioesterase PaaI-like protein